MSVVRKMTNDERRAAIIKAVRRVFARKGFHGTTTRELAEASGVSEALLFRHFPNKEALFAAMLHSCCTERDAGRIERIRQLEPSASTLALMVHFLVSLLLGRGGAGDEEVESQNRLILRSLAEDGDFARVVFRSVDEGWIAKVEECVQAAVDVGEAVDGPASARLRGLLAYNLVAAVKHHLLPPTPAVDYGSAREDLIEPVVWFCLRGMGLTDRAIRKHYNSKALALFAN